MHFIEIIGYVTSLDCSKNQITNLDLDNSIALKTLNCYKNNLTSLILKENSALTFLNCENNDIFDLDFSASVKLEELKCDIDSLVAKNEDDECTIRNLYLKSTPPKKNERSAKIYIPFQRNLN